MTINFAPRVSVIIPTYNMASYVSYAVGSALDDEFWNKEIIVVDDGSTDGTEKALRPYLDRIRYIRKEQNAGLSEARNTAIAAAQGDYIRLLDADDILCRGSLRRQAETLDAHPSAAMVWGQAPVIDRHGKIYDERVSQPPCDSELVPSDKAFDWLLRGNEICASAVMLRRSVFESTGLFDRQSEPGEDWGMWLMVTNAFDVAYVAMPVVYYRNHPDSITAHYTVEWKQASHVHSLQRVFASPKPHYRQLEWLSYARLDTSLALTAAELRERRTALRYLARSVRRRPAQVIDRTTWRATGEVLKSLLPRPLVRSISRTRIARRRLAVEDVPPRYLPERDPLAKIMEGAQWR